MYQKVIVLKNKIKQNKTPKFDDEKINWPKGIRIS